MDFVARVIEVLPKQEGVSSRGNQWRKGEWIVESFGPYPKKVKITVFGSRLDTVNLEMGKVYTLSVDLESREFNGRWYTDVNCFAARETEAPTNGGIPAYNPAQPVAAPAAAAFTQPGQDPFAAPAAGTPGSTAFEDTSDDLPF